MDNRRKNDDIWNKATIETAPDLIITGAKTIDDNRFTPSDMISLLNTEHTSILDFGCGIGRNIFKLADKYQKVNGFDFPNMLAMLANNPKFIEYSNIELYNNWNIVKEKKYDAIFACLVLQHIHPELIDEYMLDFTKMTNVIYIHSRAYTDYTYDLIWPIFMKYWQLDKGYNITEKQIELLREEDHFMCKLIPRTK